mgnify:CR=1 FL=1
MTGVQTCALPISHKAEALGYHPEVILAGRRINDNMGIHVAGQVIKLMAKHNHPIKNGRILVLGMTFKENCPDIRNSKVVDVIKELSSYGADVDVFDPHADHEETMHEYQVPLLRSLDKRYHAIVLAVGHSEFANLPWDKIRSITEVKIYEKSSDSQYYSVYPALRVRFEENGAAMHYNFSGESQNSVTADKIDTVYVNLYRYEITRKGEGEFRMFKNACSDFKPLESVASVKRRR